MWSYSKQLGRVWFMALVDTVTTRWQQRPLFTLTSPDRHEGIRLNLTHSEVIIFTVDEWLQINQRCRLMAAAWENRGDAESRLIFPYSKIHHEVCTGCSCTQRPWPYSCFSKNKNLLQPWLCAYSHNCLKAPLPRQREGEKIIAWLCRCACVFGYI